MSEAKHTPETFIDNFLFAAANDDNLRRLPITATLVEIAVEAVNNHDRLKAERDRLLEALKTIHDALGSYPCVVDYSRWLSITGAAIAAAENE